MREDLGGPDDRGVVVERLPLTLEDSTGDLTRRLLPDGHELRHDLPRLEAARQAEAAGRAEIAGHRAAGLTGEADCEATGNIERNPHGFRHRAVREAKEVLDEAIRGVGSPLHD